MRCLLFTGTTNIVYIGLPLLLTQQMIEIIILMAQQVKGT